MCSTPQAPPAPHLAHLRPGRPARPPTLGSRRPQRRLPAGRRTVAGSLGRLPPTQRAPMAPACPDRLRPPARSPVGRGATTPPAPAPPALRPRGWPGTTRSRTPCPHARVAGPAGRRRLAGTSWSDRGHRDTHSGRTPQACAPTSRSRADSRCDACPGRATAPNARPTAARTRPRSAPCRSASRLPHRSTGPAPSRCCA